MRRFLLIVAFLIVLAFMSFVRYAAYTDSDNSDPDWVKARQDLRKADQDLLQTIRSVMP